MPGQRIATRCPTCKNSLKKGHLWLGGGDYLECPDCGGTTIFVMFEQRITPGKSILMPGLKRQETGRVIA
jgi:DNA-directed RNA polymerase subunit RPC12/RpoP